MPDAKGASVAFTAGVQKAIFVKVAMAAGASGSQKPNHLAAVATRTSSSTLGSRIILEVVLARNSCGPVDVRPDTLTGNYDVNFDCRDVSYIGRGQEANLH